MTVSIGFRELVHPITVDEFLRSYLGARHFVTDGKPFDVVELFGWDDLNDLLAGTELESTPSSHDCIEVTAGDRRLGPDNLCRKDSASGSRRPIDPVRLTHALRAGAQLTVRRVEVRHRRVALLGDEIGRHVRMPVSARVSAVWRPLLETQWQATRADIFVLQLDGRHHWSVRPSGGSPAGTGRHVLRPGAVAYVPSGWEFRNAPFGCPSAQLVMEAVPATTAELVEWTVARLLEDDDELRQPPPADEAERAADEADLSARVVAACEDASLPDRFRADRDASAIEPRAWFGLPWTATSEVLPPEHVSLRLNGPRFPVQRTIGGRIEYRMRGGRFELDESVAEALAPIFAGQRTTVGKLLNDSCEDVRTALIDLLLAGHVVPDEG